MLIDTHCHPARFAEDGNLDAVLARAVETGVNRIIAIGTGTDDWDVYAKLAAANTGRVDYTVGLHPCDVTDAWEKDISQLPEFFSGKRGPKPVALGEIGLDRFHLPKDTAEAAVVFARQEAAFRAQLKMAKEFACPFVIHSRESFADCVRVLDESDVDWNRVVFHCYANGPAEVKEILRRGGRASFTGIITYKNADNVRAALLEQGIDRLMLETDAPYLAPTPHRGKPNEPAFVAHIATEAARILSLTAETLAARTSENARLFFGLH